MEPKARENFVAEASLVHSNVLQFESHWEVSVLLFAAGSVDDGSGDCNNRRRRRCRRCHHCPPVQRRL